MTRNDRIFKIGICDWTLNMVQNEYVFQKAKALGFDGVQVAFDNQDINKSLLNEKVQESYKRNSIQYNVPICSCAAVNFMRTPMIFSEDPVSILSGYIKVMKSLGVKKILLPFFGRGDINPKTTLRSSVMRIIRKMPSKVKMLEMTLEILKKIAYIAESAKITVGLETYMYAESLKVILDRIGSDRIKVYYDVGNAHLMGYNIFNEIRLLSINSICEIHLKEMDTTIGSGKINYRNIMELLVADGYKDWLIIEDSINRSSGLEISMKKNLFYLKGLMQQN
jgi:L-ribulose-5-phosphate 3-epimerase